MTPKSGVMFLKNSPLCRGHVSENGVGNVSEKHALKWGHDPDKSHQNVENNDRPNQITNKSTTIAILLLPGFLQCQH